jgi:type VI secretion system secreted protein Hcp
MRFCRLIALSCCLLLAEFHPASAQIFLRLDGVTGSATETNHIGWMTLDSLQQGVARGISSASGGGNRQASDPSFSEFTVSKQMDSGSPQLALLAAGGGGNIINSGTIDLVQLASGQARYIRINLTNILISSYSQSSGGGVPSESVSLAPLMISWNYTFYGKTSGLPVAYDFYNWNLATSMGNSGTNPPAFVSTGIRSAGGVQLGWIAIAGHHYRIFAVSDLSKPFVAIAEFTAPTSGITNYTFAPVAPAMFYTVQEVPDGY